VNEAALLASLRTRDGYESHHKYIQPALLIKETKTLVDDFGEYYKVYPTAKEIDSDTFTNWFRMIRHPGLKLEKYELFDVILTNALSTTPDPNITDRLVELEYSAKMKAITSEIDKGMNTDANFRKLQTIGDEYTKKKGSKNNLSEYVVDMDIARLVGAVLKGHGIKWRLEELNVSVGQIHKSDLIMVGKRPETGGTTFLLSELTYMLAQLPEGKNAIIFNNEEGGDKLGLRAIQAALNKTAIDVEGDIIGIAGKYSVFLAGKRLDIVHKVDIATWEIDKQLSNGDYWLIGVNTLNKVHSNSKDLDDVKRRAGLANWARGVADKHGAVICIDQAGEAAEGVAYLNMTHLYGSRTSVQGEIDVLLMIGKTEEVGKEEVRYITVCKNKKPTTGKMRVNLKHAKFEVRIDTERSRFIGTLVP